MRGRKTAARGTGRRRSGVRAGRVALRRILASGVAALVSAACDGVSPGATGRPDDGLLERSDLQQVVELQGRRDGAGLAALLEDEDPRVRARAAFALGSVQDPRVRDALEARLADPEAPVRADAAFALGQLGDTAAAPALMGALESEADPAVRAELWQALGKAGDSLSLVAVDVEGLGSEEAAAAALALARFGMRGIHDEEKIRWLADAVASEDPRLRRNAAYYFGRAPDPDVWLSQIQRVRAALDGYGKDDPAAMHLVQGLGNQGRLADVPRLISWLREGEDWRIRVSAARGIGMKLGMAPPVWLPLLEALDDSSRHVAVAASEVMANNLPPVPRAMDDMKTWIDAHPDDWRVAGPLVVSLALHGEDEFVEGWVDRWSPDDEGPWAPALEALSLVGSPDAVRRLVEATRSPSRRVAGAAAEALVTRWENDRHFPVTHDVYYEAFRDAIQTGDLRVVVAVAPALADSIFEPYGSVDLLARAYRGMAMPRDVEPMVAVLAALGETGEPGAAPVLEEAAGHPHEVIAGAAQRALDALRGREGEDDEGLEARADSATAGQADSISPAGGRPAPEAAPDWDFLREVGSHPRLALETVRGRIVVELDTEEAPITVQTLARLARAGSLDGVPFHRVVPNFVIQGGDFERGDGFGGPGYSIPSEFTRIAYERGTIGMASAGKDTEGSQYFIAHSMQPHLDGRYTAFGRVVEGMEVVDRIRQEDEVTRAVLEPGG